MVSPTLKRLLRDLLWGGLAAALALFGTTGLLSLFASRPAVLNVSYDPTRELWAELNDAFARQSSETVNVRMSHGGSSSQARAIIDGLPADVATLALWSDIDALRERGMIAEGWESRFPPPWSSTIVFVVRAGNRKNIRDWPDLIRDKVTVITPNPKTSGNGRLSFLAAWGAIQTTTGSEEQARDFVRELYRHVPVLDTGARGSTLTFAQKKIGDVQLTWENEAYQQLAEAPGAFEIVYPSRSIRAEPPVAIVDRVVDRKGTRRVAEAYLRFLSTDAGQEIIGRHHFRTTNPKFATIHHEIDCFAITDIEPRGWPGVQDRFFGENGEFDRMR